MPCVSNGNMILTKTVQSGLKGVQKHAFKSTVDGQAVRRHLWGSNGTFSFFFFFFFFFVVVVVASMVQWFTRVS